MKKREEMRGDGFPEDIDMLDNLLEEEVSTTEDGVTNTEEEEAADEAETTKQVRALIR